MRFLLDPDDTEIIYPEITVDLSVADLLTELYARQFGVEPDADKTIRFDVYTGVLFRHSLNYFKLCLTNESAGRWDVFDGDGNPVTFNPYGYSQVYLCPEWVSKLFGEDADVLYVRICRQE